MECLALLAVSGYYLEMFNAAHLHLALNHIAVIGIPFCLFGYLWALRKSSDELRRFFAAALVLISMSSIAAFLSGGEAEELVEHLSGVSEKAIEIHEEAAELAFYLTLLCGALGLVILLALNKFRATLKLLDPALILLMLVSSGLLARAALLGGEIRHTEIRSDFMAIEIKRNSD